MSGFPIGSISHGTLVTSDLLDSFIDALAMVCDSQTTAQAQTDHDNLVELKDAFEEFMEDYEDQISSFPKDAKTLIDEDIREHEEELLASVTEMLENSCPSHVRFGAHEGDGSDFGFWPDVESLERAVIDGEVLKVNGLEDVPDDYEGEVMVVNDHGNVTYGGYTKQTGFVENWAVV